MIGHAIADNYTTGTQHPENFPGKFSPCCGVVTYLSLFFMIGGAQDER